MKIIDNPISRYDIAIIGAGPAGSNFARLAKLQGKKVLLVDGAPPRGKVCGGLISPDAQGVLARYGLNLPRDILVSPQLFSVRTVDLETKLIRYYRRNYLNVDRAAFDRYFLEMVPDTVDYIRARCVSIARSGRGFELKLEKSPKYHKVICDYAIGADGASSIVRSSLFGDRKIKKYTAIQQWFAAEGSDPCYSCVFDNSTSESCSWIFFKDGKLIFGGAFSPQGCRAAFEEQKRKLAEMGAVDAKIFEKPLFTEACRVARPRLSGGIFRGGKNAFLIGEAAGFISPSSLEGISFALESSEALADAFSENFESGGDAVLKKYKRLSGWLCVKVAQKCLKRPFMYQKALRTAVMRSGLTAVRMKNKYNL